MGVIKYIPTNAYPLEATELLRRMSMFFAPGLIMNQIPKQDVLVRNRVLPADRKVATLGPVYELKGRDVGVVKPGKIGVKK